MRASTTRTAAGRDAACGAPTATARRGSPRTAWAAVRAPCTSRCARIRSRIDGVTLRKTASPGATAPGDVLFCDHAAEGVLHFLFAEADISTLRRLRPLL